jgi:hypothetical protein
MSKLLKEQIVGVEKVAPMIYKMTVESSYVSQNARPGQFINIKCSDGVGMVLRRPISIAGVSAILGGLLPCLGSRVRPFTDIPPNLFKSIYRENSLPKPKVPEAAITGFFSFKPAISTLKSTLSIISMILLCHPLKQPDHSKKPDHLYIHVHMTNPVLPYLT